MKKRKLINAPPPPTGDRTHPSTRGNLSRRRWVFLAGAGAATAAGALGYWLTNGFSLYSRRFGQAPEFTYEVVNRYPHREDAYTQGLVFADGVLYEGTGGWGTSFLRKVDLETGEPLQQSDTLPQSVFGEGIALWNDTIIQLTWENGVALVWDRETFQSLPPFFRYTGEGWGLTHDGRQLIMSNGSHRLYFRDPDTFRVTRVLEVQNDGQLVPDLNELEYIGGEIYANVWQEDCVVRVSPQTGAVVSWVNLRGLRPEETRSDPDKVLNGIAYDPDGQRLFVTGKLWPWLYEIRLIAT